MRQAQKKDFTENEPKEDKDQVLESTSEGDKCTKERT